MSVRSRTWWLLLACWAYIWFRVIDHLRIEWSLNGQYTYGFAVPFLCAALLYRRWISLPAIERSRLSIECTTSGLVFQIAPLQCFTASALLFLFLLTRW